MTEYIYHHPRTGAEMHIKANSQTEALEILDQITMNKNRWELIAECSPYEFIADDDT